MISNPVLRKELAGNVRMRQLPRVARVGCLLLIASLIGTIYYYVIVRFILADRGTTTAVDTWHVVVILQAALICLISPSIAANSITREKEQQTWEMLLFTMLQPSQIVFGKLLARLYYLGLMILIFMPIELACWAKASNEITTAMVALTYLVMAVSALCFTTISLYVSWVVKRTIYSIMSGYSIVIGGLVICTSLSAAVVNGSLANNPLMWINPILMFGQAIDPHIVTGGDLTVAIITYLLATALMLTRMIIRLRDFSLEA